MRREKQAKRHRMDPVVALAIVFAVLKVTGVISWPWVWVLSPIWLTYLFFSFTFFTLFLFCRITKVKK